MTFVVRERPVISFEEKAPDINIGNVNPWVRRFSRHSLSFRSFDGQLNVFNGRVEGDLEVCV